MTTITAGVFLRLTNEYTWMQDAYLKAKAQGDHAGMIDAGIVTIQKGGSSHTVVGKGTVTIELLDEKQVAQNMVASLREQKKEVLAKAQAEATALETKIQNLLAIENTPS